jgi:hypothetical protein
MKRRRQIHPSIAAAVLPSPVGTSSRPRSSGLIAKRAWYGKGEGFSVACSKKTLYRSLYAGTAFISRQKTIMWVTVD